MKKSISLVFLTSVLFFALSVQVFASENNVNENLKKTITKINDVNNEYEVKLNIDGEKINYIDKYKDTNLDVVLVMDRSKNMYDNINDVDNINRMEMQKNIVTKFIEDLESNDCNVNVGLVVFGKYAQKMYELIDVKENAQTLKNIVNNIEVDPEAGQNNKQINQEQGIFKAKEILENSTATEKLVIMFGNESPTWAGPRIKHQNAFPQYYYYRPKYGNGDSTTNEVKKQTEKTANKLKDMQVKDGNAVQLVPVLLCNEDENIKNFQAGISSINNCYCVDSEKLYIKDILDDVYPNVVEDNKYQNVVVTEKIDQNCELIKNSMEVTQGETIINEDGKISWIIGNICDNKTVTMTYKIKNYKHQQSNNKTIINYNNQLEGNKEEKFKVDFISNIPKKYKIKYEMINNDTGEKKCYDYNVLEGESVKKPCKLDPSLEIVSDNWVGIDNVQKDQILTRIVKTKVFDVKFFVDDKQIGKTQKIKYGNSATEPNKNLYIKESRLYSKWDKKFLNITSNLVINKKSSIKTFKVIYVDENNKEIKQDIVNYNENSIAPSFPNKNGITYLGWDIVENNKIKKPVLCISKRSINYINFKDEIYEVKDGKIVGIKDNIVVKALCEKNNYTVIYKYEDTETNEIKTISTISNIVYGEKTPTPPDNLPEGYEFVDDKKFGTIDDIVTKNVVYIAKIRKSIIHNVKYIVYDQTNRNKYVMDFHIVDGKSVKSPMLKDFVNLPKDFNIKYQETNSKTSWKDIENVSKNIIMWKNYKVKEYVVTIDYDNGEENDKIIVKHGEDVSKLKTPSKKNHKFIGWSMKSLKNITHDITIEAQYEEINKDKSDELIVDDGQDDSTTDHNNLINNEIPVTGNKDVINDLEIKNDREIKNDNEEIKNVERHEGNEAEVNPPTGTKDNQTVLLIYIVASMFIIFVASKKILKIKK